MLHRARVVVGGSALFIASLVPGGSAAADPPRINVPIAPVLQSAQDAKLINVTRSPPMTSRWWFWTGAGVLVAGAAIAIVAASTEQSPSQGSLGTFRVP